MTDYVSVADKRLGGRVIRRRQKLLDWLSDRPGLPFNGILGASRLYERGSKRSRYEKLERDLEALAAAHLIRYEQDVDYTLPGKWYAT